METDQLILNPFGWDINQRIFQVPDNENLGDELFVTATELLKLISSFTGTPPECINGSKNGIPESDLDFSRTIFLTIMHDRYSYLSLSVLGRFLSLNHKSVHTYLHHNHIYTKTEGQRNSDYRRVYLRVKQFWNVKMPEFQKFEFSRKEIMKGISLPALADFMEGKVIPLEIFSQLLFETIVEQTGITKEEIMSDNRKQGFVFIRKMMCYILNATFRRNDDPLKISLSSIGRIVNKDHATVLHSIEGHNDLVETHLDYKELFSRISRIHVVKMENAIAYFHKVPFSEFKEILKEKDINESIIEDFKIELMEKIFKNITFSRKYIAVMWSELGYGDIEL